MDEGKGPNPYFEGLHEGESDELRALRALAKERDELRAAFDELTAKLQAQPKTLSQRLADAGFTRRPSLRAMDMREALELIAAPMRTDGTWNRDRTACQQLAAEALGRDDEAERLSVGDDGVVAPYKECGVDQYGNLHAPSRG